ncbi:MAG: molybdopterin molybdenumtransferase MoeA [Planctomycetota bacterium]|nr:MAG: molybdopterin molybdenumtransferase MoeA [Planctomycetota bacterium]
MTAAMPTEFAFDSPEAALKALVARVKPVGVEHVSLQDAVGRVLAEPIRADRPSPACDVSAMDGYAICIEDLRPGRLPVAGEIPIATEPPAMHPGAVLRIVTGAAVPPQAHAVIRREDCIEQDRFIELTAQTVASIKPGLNIRRCGENCPKGAEIIPSGTLVTPARLGALATVGCTQPRVRRRVRVAVLVTGDEVLCPDEMPKPWELRDSNGPSLGALLGAHAWNAVDVRPRVVDDERTLCDAVEAALAESDAVVCTGGVSMGGRDYVPGVVRKVGAEVIFHRLPQKPGKPALGAVSPDGKPVFGLPGNPVSVLVTARRLALPALSARAGLARLCPPTLVRLAKPDDKTLNLWWHRLVRITEPGVASLLPTMGSGDIPSAATSDGFVEIPPAATANGLCTFYSWFG